jgi:ADP-ribosyl-[dinitrogen reductase] hydrolase
MEEIKTSLEEILKDRFSKDQIQELYQDINFCLADKKTLLKSWIPSKNLDTLQKSDKLYTRTDTNELEEYNGSQKGNFIENGFRFFEYNGYKFKSPVSIKLSDSDKQKILDRIEMYNPELDTENLFKPTVFLPGEIVEGQIFEQNFFFEKLSKESIKNDIILYNQMLPHERCNYITDEIIIGACPTKETLKKMEEFGITVFIDLREKTEYNTEKIKYHFPILSGRPPTKKQADEILKIVQNLSKNDIVYIHCNGGHGRAGTVAAYIIGKEKNLDASEAIKYIEKARETRQDTSKNFIPTPEMAGQVKFLVSQLGLKSGNIAPDRSDLSWLKKVKSERCGIEKEIVSLSPLTEIQTVENQNNVILDRIQGMMMGVFLGDTLGAPHEFRESKFVYTGHLQYETHWRTQFQGVKSLSIGQVTDDSEMTITLCRELIKDGGFNRDKVILAYLDWANSNNWSMGKNTRALLKNVKTLKGYQKRMDKVLQIPEDQRTQSNGALMRCSPLALFSDYKNIARQDCSITNPNSLCIEIETLYLTILRQILLGNPVDINFKSENENISILLQQIKNDSRNIIKNQGWVVHSFYCVLLSLYKDWSFTEAMRQIITRKGDTDTNAAIAGAVLGAKIGYKNLYKEQKENIDIILSFDSETGLTKRPKRFSPFDFDDLSKNLFSLFQK